MLFIFALSVKGWIESLFSCSRIEPRNAVDQMPPTKAPGGEKKLEIFFVNFFLSPVAGQVVDVGASWPGGAALPRVDLAFDPIGKKVKIFLSPVAGQAVDVGASRAGRLPCSESISLSIRSKKK